MLYDWTLVYGPPLPAVELSVAVRSKLKVPVAVGVPDNAPPDRVSPVGSAPSVRA